MITPVCPLVSISVDILDITESAGQPVVQVDMRELRKQQNADSCVGFTLRAVKDKTKPDKAHIHTREDAAMLKSFESFKIIRGLLYRKVDSESETKNPLLPFYYLEQVLLGLHNDVGHPSKDRNMSFLRDRFLRSQE